MSIVASLPTNLRTGFPVRSLWGWLLALLVLTACAQAPHDPTEDGDGPDDYCGECPEHAFCDPETRTCTCEDGFEPLGGRCVMADEPDSDGEEFPGDTPDDGDIDDDEPTPDGDDEEEPEDGDEKEPEDGDEEEPEDGDEEDPEDGDEENPEDGDEEDPNDAPPCPTPQTPTLSPIHRGAVLAFSSEEAGNIQIGTSLSREASAPDAWLDATDWSLDTVGEVVVFARLIGENCEPAPFRFVYDVREAYSPAAVQEGTSAIPKDDSKFVGWAVAVESVVYGPNVEETWKTPEKTLGPATGETTDIVSLGDGGHITLRFDPPIRSAPGADFAVFGNSFSDTFLELAFVEVSSDATTFLRFDQAHLATEPVGAFGTLDPTLLSGFAGKYRVGYGTPFDLNELANRQEVRDGLVDLEAIGYVRIVDVVGDGSETDSFGNAIYDPYPTVGSGGFDLEAVGVLNQ